MGLVIERLLRPGLILEQAMRCFVLGKDTLCLFPSGAEDLLAAEAQREEKNVLQLDPK